VTIALRGTPQGGGFPGPSVTINVPAGVVNGDFLMASISGFKSAGITPATPVDPAGWTKIGVVDSIASLATDNVRTAWYWRLAASEPASYVFTNTIGAGDNYIDADIIAFFGVDPVTSFNLAGVGAGGNSLNPTSADLGVTTADLCWHVLHFACYTANLTGPPASYTQDLLYDGSGLELSHRIVTPAGATGARAVTSSGSDGWTAWACALQPVAGVPVGSAPHWYLSSRIV
jgi:hypothetical protein